ncbi:MAG: hypothetical protein IJ767_00975 [Bacteroidaceae bacterium]|nr:hypothetical protein [Bacteroidaceae bacterium]
MRRIDKSTHKIAGDQVTKDYLDHCCLQPNGRYESVRYDSKRDPGNGPCFCTAAGGAYRKRMTTILLENQNGYCCYCMRKIKTAQNELDSDEVVTREHIIPRGFSHGDIAKVQSYYQLSPELAPGQVLLTDDFESVNHDQSADFPPYPHKVAYNNLVASCNGTFPYVRNEKQGKPKICCNEARLEEDAYPIYFIDGIETMIDYLENGDMQAKCTVEPDLQKKITDVIDNAHLTCDPLRDIRRLWFILSHVPKKDIYSCRTEAQRDELLSKMLYKTEFFNERAITLHESFKKSAFWETFMLYDYFYDVFKDAA